MAFLDIRNEYLISSTFWHGNLSQDKAKDVDDAGHQRGFSTQYEEKRTSSIV